MKNVFYLLILLFIGNSCSTYRQDLPINTCQITENINANYSKSDALREALKQFVWKGAPGAALAVSSEEGWWTTATGLAKIEDQTPMQICHLQYLQSIAKTYMAVAVLKLYEQGQINLDAPFTKYLPKKYHRYITHAEKITVRMLLNHTTGIPEYNFAPNYVTQLLQHPDHDFTVEDYLKYIEGKELDFVPGSRYSYRNTNYVILALIVDAITGDHAEFITESIFKPLGLKQTYYRNDPGYLNYPNLTNAYWDRNSNGVVENASQLQRNNVAALIGDDGIVATPVEAVKFLKGLMEGKLLSVSTMKEMQTWIENGEGKPAYGLGLTYTTINGEVAYGHSGGGIGAGCELYYFPKQNIYFFIGMNLGTITESALHQEMVKTRDKIYEVLLK